VRPCITGPVTALAPTKLSIGLRCVSELSRQSGGVFPFLSSPIPYVHPGRLLELASWSVSNTGNLLYGGTSYRVSRVSLSNPSGWSGGLSTAQRTGSALATGREFDTLFFFFENFFHLAISNYSKELMHLISLESLFTSQITLTTGAIGETTQPLNTNKNTSILLSVPLIPIYQIP